MGLVILIGRRLIVMLVCILRRLLLRRRKRKRDSNSNGKLCFLEMDWGVFFFFLFFFFPREFGGSGMVDGRGIVIIMSGKHQTFFFSLVELLFGMVCIGSMSDCCLCLELSIYRLQFISRSTLKIKITDVMHAGHNCLAHYKP